VISKLSIVTKEGLIQYREFMDWVTDTSGASFYSKKDLEDYEHSAISAEEKKTL